MNLFVIIVYVIAYLSNFDKPIPAPLKILGRTSMMWFGQYFL